MTNHESPDQAKADSPIRMDDYEVDPAAFARIHRAAERIHDSEDRQPYLAYVGAVIPFAAAFALWGIVEEQFHASMSLPILLAIGAVAVLVLALLGRRSWRQSLRRAMTLHGYPTCVKCGYALRGLPECVDNCPECGAKRKATFQGPNRPNTSI